ncbi:MAG: ParB/RepB/Spo0J family partition protein [Rickettsiales bacterium]|jgi:ParB family chromosome partitioning protein|nr:ParB/RepB/Spo0J family partition protein [Rickettsiales bacterium]
MLENKKLARGLSSLLGEKNLSIINLKTEIALDDVVTRGNQPRRDFNEEDLRELAGSIEKYGILQPILVRRVEGDRYEIIAGERRYRSARMANLKTIPAIVKDFDEKEIFSLSVVENVQRKNLNPIEEALAYRHLIDERGYSQQDLSAVMGKSRSHIANLLRLLSLPDAVQRRVEEGKLEMGHARALVGCPQAEAIAEKIVENGMSVREVENLVKNTNLKDSKSGGEPRPTASKSLGDRAKELSRKIKMSCRINYSEESDSGTVNIKFHSLEELDNFINDL